MHRANSTGLNKAVIKIAEIFSSKFRQPFTTLMLYTTAFTTDILCPLKRKIDKLQFNCYRSTARPLPAFRKKQNISATATVHAMASRNISKLLVVENQVVRKKDTLALIETFDS